jgi:hypothetical protein
MQQYRAASALVPVAGRIVLFQHLLQLLNIVKCWALTCQATL